MHLDTNNIVATTLVTAGVLVEANLLRIFVGDWMKDRRQRKTNVASRIPNRKPLACAAVLAFPTLAMAQSPSPSTVITESEPPAAQAATSAPSTPATGNQTETSKPIDFSAEDALSLTISTDRGSFSDGTGIQPVLRVNIETGYTFTLRDRDDIETQRHNGPEILARVGIIEDRLELRFITSGYAWSRTDDGSGDGFNSSEGWNDFALGLKLKVTDQDRWIPRLVLGAQTTLGGGSDNISSQLVEPTIKLLWSYDMAQATGNEAWKGVTLGGNLNAAFTSTNGDRFTQGQVSIYLSGPLFERTNGFVEYFVLCPNSKGEDAAHYASFGGTHLLTNTIQLDARVGFGLNEEADNVFVGAGISFLF